MARSETSPFPIKEHSKQQLEELLNSAIEAECVGDMRRHGGSYLLEQAVDAWNEVEDALEQALQILSAQKGEVWANRIPSSPRDMLQELWDRGNTLTPEIRLYMVQSSVSLLGRLSQVLYKEIQPWLNLKIDGLDREVSRLPEDQMLPLERLIRINQGLLSATAFLEAYVALDKVLQADTSDDIALANFRMVSALGLGWGVSGEEDPEHFLDRELDPDDIADEIRLRQNAILSTWLATAEGCLFKEEGPKGIRRMFEEFNDVRDVECAPLPDRIPGGYLESLVEWENLPEGSEHSYGELAFLTAAETLWIGPNPDYFDWLLNQQVRRLSRRRS